MSKVECVIEEEPAQNHYYIVAVVQHEMLGIIPSTY